MKIKRDLLSHNSIKREEDEDGVGADSVSDSHCIVVEVEDENGGPEGEVDLGIFAPVESSECEEDGEEERSRGTNNGHRGLDC